MSRLKLNKTFHSKYNSETEATDGQIVLRKRQIWTSHNAEYNSQQTEADPQARDFLVPLVKLKRNKVEMNKRRMNQLLQSFQNPVNCSQLFEQENNQSRTSQTKANRKIQLETVAKNYVKFSNSFRPSTVSPNNRYNRNMQSTPNKRINYGITKNYLSDNSQINISSKQGISMTVDNLLNFDDAEKEEIQIDYRGLERLFKNQQVEPKKRELITKLNQEYIISDNRRIPFNLHLINSMSKQLVKGLLALKDQQVQKMLSEETKKTNIKKYQPKQPKQKLNEEQLNQDIVTDQIRQEINTKIKPQQEKFLKDIIFKKEKDKKYKEFTTRNSYSNPYCQILALNKKSRQNLKQRIRETLPIESRFQMQNI